MKNKVLKKFSLRLYVSGRGRRDTKNILIFNIKCNIRRSDIDDQKLLLHDPKSRRVREIVFIPRKISRRLSDYVNAKDIPLEQRIFPITYAGVRTVVKKVGRQVGIKLHLEWGYYRLTGKYQLSELLMIIARTTHTRVKP